MRITGFSSSLLPLQQKSLCTIVVFVSSSLDSSTSFHCFSLLLVLGLFRFGRLRETVLIHQQNNLHRNQTRNDSRMRTTTRPSDKSRLKRIKNRGGGCSLPVVFLVLLSLAYFWIYFSIASIDTASPSSTSSLRTPHDPYYIKSHPPKFGAQVPGVCDVPPGQGEEGPDGIQGLFKIKMAEKGPEPTEIKVLCMVYTHSGRHNVLQSIVETYAPYCDGFLAASNLTDPRLGAMHLPHAGPEAYENMWNKVQAMWFYAHENHLFDFNWFHIGGDDMYLIPSNLRRTAAHFPSNKRAWILGGSIPNSKNPKRRYCGGGAGYTLNRKALQLLVSQMTSGECPAETAPDEDVRLSRCLEDVGIRCTDTNDEDEEMRYHHLDAQFHAAWVPTRNAVWLWEKLQYFHGIRGNQSQLAQISNTSVSFHLDKSTVRSKARDRGIRRYHAILYDLCGSNFAKQVAQAATCRNDEREMLTAIWKGVPKAKDTTTYDIQRLRT